MEIVFVFSPTVTSLFGGFRFFFCINLRGLALGVVLGLGVGINSSGTCLIRRPRDFSSSDSVFVYISLVSVGLRDLFSSLDF